jgi:subtilisin family serine protease
VRIAVLDGGYALDHEAFQHLDVIAQYDFINNDDNPDYDPSQDVPGQPGHGTGCMSVIGGYLPGNLIGIAHEASFILCKTEHVPTETVVEEDNWVRALEWSEALGADVLSSSLSYKDWYTLADYDGVTPITSRAAQIAFELGMVLCTSAGNEGPGQMTLGAPTDAEGVLSIGALRPNGDLAGFSSRGPTSDGRIKPDVCAQGVRVAAVRPRTWNRYAFWNGTSLSCPVVAGCMALLLAEHPDWSPAKVYEAARETASRANRPDNDWGWGLIDLEEAIYYPSISGWILNADGRGLPGIELRLFGEVETLTVMTNEDGFYRFPNLEWGTVRLQVIWEDGTMSAYRTLEVPPSEGADFVEDGN